MDYALHLCVLILIYAALASSLDLLVGHTGLVSIAHAAFFGIGSYTAALLSLRFGVDFSISSVACIFAAVLLSLSISLPSLRLHGDYFLLATFAFQVIAYDIFTNWTEVTRGPLGIPGIPRPVVFGWHVESQVDYVFLALAFAAVAVLTVSRLASAPFGRVLRAIRDDERFTASTGRNTRKFKVRASAVSAAIASSAGGLYAHYIGYIDPTTFTVTQSILILSMVIIGGAESHFGPLVGAFMLVILPELFRFVGLNDNIAAHLREVAYGSMITLLMMFRPQGILGRYRFDR